GRQGDSREGCRCFFFQAEDGIRDFHVTGVQTCALPLSEVEAMRERMADIRKRVHAMLAAKLPGYDADYFVRQQGMFTYSGLSRDQLLALRERHGVYIIDSGRVAVPGLNTANIGHFTDALVDVLEHV